MTKADKGRIALRAFFNIAKLWGLTEEEQLLILGQPAKSTFEAWRREEPSSVARDTLERISYVVGIYQAINSLLSDKEIAAEWVRKPNSAPIFGADSALDRMTAGNVSDLFVVRQYLDAEAPQPSNAENRLFGVLRSEISVADDFDKTPQEIIDAMEGH